MKQFLLALLLVFQSVQAQAQEVTFISNKGESISMDVNSHLPLQHILNEASVYLASLGDQYNVYVTNVKMESASLAAKAGRDYNQPATPQQRQDIAYIVKTLGTAPYKSLLKNKGSLKSAGDRIDSVHPLRFLQVIFSDEELKAGAHAVRQRTFFVWGEFFGGLKDSLDEEYTRGNLTDEQVIDFSKNVGINPNAVINSIHARDWQHFYDILLKEIPRQGNPTRYNM